MVAAILFQAALWIWFLGCTTTYRLGKYTLVEGMGIKSAEFATLCLYTMGLLFYYLMPAGKWILLAVLILWFVVEFFCHTGISRFLALPNGNWRATTNAFAIRLEFSP